MLLEVIEVRLDHAEHAFQGGSVRAGDRLDPGGDRTQALLEHRRVERALRAEVIGDGTQVGSGLLGDGPNRGAVVAAPTEEAATRCNQPGTRLFADVARA